MKKEIKIETLRTYIVLHLLIMLLSLSSLFTKFASSFYLISFQFMFFYGCAILIMIVYAIFWQQLLKVLPLSVAIANKGVVVIWAMIWGTVFFNEKISMQMIIGGLIIITGVYLVTSDD